jgi:hypothetical protein
MDTTTKDGAQEIFGKDDLPDSLIKGGFRKIFEKDDEGRYTNLVIPSIGGLHSLDLRGKKDLELTPEEITTKKVYYRELSGIMARDREVLAYGNC